MIQSTAYLDKVFPHRPLRNQTLLSLEMLTSQVHKTTLNTIYYDFLHT